MTPPRTLLVSHGLPPERVGGAELVTWRTARLLVRGGIEVAVVHTDHSVGAQAGVTVRTEAAGVVRYALGTPGGADDWPPAASAFSRILSLWQPEVVWIHHLSGLTLGIPPMLHAEGIPYAITFHDYWWMCPRGQLVDGSGERCEGPGPSRCPACLAPGAPGPVRPIVRHLTSRWWEERQRRCRRFLARASLTTAPTRHVAQRHEAWLAGATVDVLANPAAEIGPIPPPPAAGPLRLGYFGSLIPTKGIETLLGAFSRLPTGVATLDLFGPLPTGRSWRQWRERIRRLASKCGAHLHGPYPPAEVASKLAEVEVVCLPSVWEENAPVVITEAVAAGRAVVASDIGGIPEVLAGREGAVLLPPGDIQAWTVALGDVAGLRRHVLRAVSSAHRTRSAVGDTAEVVVRAVSRIRSR